MPIVVKFDNDILYSELLEWLARLEDKSFVYLWPFREVTFYNKDDAIAFMLTFNGEQVYTKIEQMIKYTLND